MDAPELLRDCPRDYLCSGRRSAGAAARVPSECNRSAIGVPSECHLSAICIASRAPQGYGTFRWAAGTVYEGEWQSGVMHGYGTYYFADGCTYQGQYV